MNDKELKELNKFKSRSIIKQEKIDKALKEINELIKFYDKYVEAGYTISPNRLSTILQHLKEIKKTLEK
jgi:hypothetical protein